MHARHAVLAKVVVAVPWMLLLRGLSQQPHLVPDQTRERVAAVHMPQVRFRVYRAQLVLLVEKRAVAIE